MLQARLLFFCLILWYPHHQIYSSAAKSMPYYAAPQQSTITNPAPPTTHVTPHTTSSFSADDMAILSLIHAPRHNSGQNPYKSAPNALTSSVQELLEEEEQRKDPIGYYRKESQQRADAYALEEQKKAERAAQLKILHEQRAQVRIEKEIVEQFIKLKDATFTTIESQSVRPVQWGDYFPITKPLFAYLGWREDEAAITEQEKYKATQKAHIIACQEMKFIIAQAIAYAQHNKPEQTIKFFADSGMDCDPLANEKADEKNNWLQNNMLFKRGNKKDTTPAIHYTRTQRLDDVICDEDGIRYKQYVFYEKNGQYKSGYLESYDGKKGGLFTLIEFADIPQSRTLQSIQSFHTYHEKSTFSMKVNYLKNTPHYQQANVDFLYNRGDITAEQAMQRYQNIAYAKQLAQAQTAVQQYEKLQHPSFLRKSINYFFNKTPQSATSHNTTSTGQNNNSSSASANQTSTNATHKTSVTPATTPIPTVHESISTNNPTLEQLIDSNTTATNNTPSASITHAPDQNSIPLPTPVQAQDRSKTLSPAQAIVANIIYNQGPQSSGYNNIPTTTYTADAQRRSIVQAQDSWMQKHRSSPTKAKSTIKNNNEAMLQHMLDTIVLAQNDTTLEIAQSGLRSWQQAQIADSDAQKKYHLQKFQQYYDTIEYSTPTQSIAEMASPISYYEYNNLLQDYTTAVTTYKNTTPRQAPSKHQQQYIDRLEKRAQALQQTKPQLYIDGTLPHQNYKLSPQAREFMICNNMNYTAFDGGKVTNFQHCLTQEILGIIESSVDIAQNYDAKSIIGQLATYNCNLAISAQQLNQSSHIQQATAVTDLAHFFDAYAQFLHNSKLFRPSSVEIHVGIMQGTAHALQKWGNFLKDLGYQPRQTIGKIAADLQTMGTNLYHVAEQVSEFMPHAYLNDLMENMHSKITFTENHQQPANTAPESSTMTQRTQRNAQTLHDGFYSAVQTAQTIVEKMMKNSLRQNVAYGTEIAVDNMIAAKITDSLYKLSYLVGNQALEVADQLHATIPTEFLDSHPIFMTNVNTGELLAIADTTGENIGAAVAAKKLADNAEYLIKNAAKAKELTDKINEITKADKAKKEVTKLNKELAEVTNATEIINVDRLKEISNDIPQVEEFRKYTNDFNNLEKLKPEEVLYLNLCDWIERKAAKINDRLKASGGIKFIDSTTKTEIIIEEFDLIHSLIGEMKPQALANRTSGGHLFIPELRAATLDIGEIKQFGNGFFDMGIRPIDSIKDFKLNSYFPLGTSIEQAVAMIETAIINPKLIEVADNIKNNTLKGFKFINQENEIFMLLIKNRTVQFYPYKPRI